VLGMLKGKDKYETIENYLFVAIVVGSLLLTSGLGLSAINSKGLSVILALSGGAITFLAIITLILSWLIKDLTGE